MESNSETVGREAAEQRLARYVVVGRLGQTFNAADGPRVETLADLCRAARPEFVAKAAVYAREHGTSPAVPALLCGWLVAAGHGRLLEPVFSRAVDDGERLRRFVDVLRGGKLGRRSLGSLGKRLVAGWFNSRTPAEIFRHSPGEGDLPTLKDVLRLAHPKPLGRSRGAMYRWLLGRDCEHAALPAAARTYEDYRLGKSTAFPDVPLAMMATLKMGQAEWCQAAMRADWRWLSSNVSVLQRHKVFAVPGMGDAVAARLSDRDAVARSGALPYRLLSTHLGLVPSAVRHALLEAVDLAVHNVPAMPGRGCLAIDLSWATLTPPARRRAGGVKTVDVAALLVSTLAAGEVTVVPAHGRDLPLDPIGRVKANINNLIRAAGGDEVGVRAALNALNAANVTAGWVILVSNVIADDFLGEWERFLARNAGARLVCLAPCPPDKIFEVDREDILTVTGFNDTVFAVMRDFLGGPGAAATLVDRIESVEV